MGHCDTKDQSRIVSIARIFHAFSLVLWYSRLKKTTKTIFKKMIILHIKFKFFFSEWIGEEARDGI